MVLFTEYRNFYKLEELCFFMFEGIRHAWELGRTREALTDNLFWFRPYSGETRVSDGVYGGWQEKMEEIDSTSEGLGLVGRIIYGISRVNYETASGIPLREPISV